MRSTSSASTASTGRSSTCRRFSGGLVGVSTLAVAVGRRETVEEVAEPFPWCATVPSRHGLRGRVATAAAWRHLDLDPPPAPTLPTGDATLFEE